MTDVRADLIITGASEVITCDPELGESRVGRIEEGALAIAGEQIVWVGNENDLPKKFAQDPGARVINVDGRAVVPGFVDSHTHLVFAGTRREEFAARAEGRPYQSGGILDTVEATRQATYEELLRLATERADRMLRSGTTTVEAKSGYALETDGEIRLIQVLNELGDTHPIDVEITFLGAHMVPDDYKDRADDYVALVCDEMIPRAKGLANWCDVFCDEGAFTPVQSRRVLEAGKAAGLGPRIHANELASSGGASVAANVGAASADHLIHLRPAEAKALALAGVVGIVCPTTAITLGKLPNVDLMREVGMKVAVASDLNPGMDPSGSLQFAAAIAVRMMGMGPEDVLLAMTSGGAAALRRTDIGRIAPGCLGDVVVMATDSVLDLGYQAGANLADIVIKRGAAVGD